MTEDIKTIEYWKRYDNIDSRIITWRVGDRE